MTLHEWHRLFSCHLPLFQDFACGMAAAYCCTSTGERLHKETSIVHTKLRNSLKHSTTVKLAHLHMHLRAAEGEGAPGRAHHRAEVGVVQAYGYVARGAPLG